VIAFILFPFTSVSQVSNFRKTITFNSITVAADSCYINHDDGNGWGGAEEDPTIVVRCLATNGSAGSGSVVFSKTWVVDIPAAGTFNLTGTALQCSPAPNAFSIDPVNILLVSSINLYVATFERENSSCDNEDNQTCGTEAIRTFNLIAGTHSINCGNITYNYTVTQTASTTPDNFCDQALPIELSLFEVNPFGNHAELVWQTSSERNNEYFTIERSSDGQFWEERTRVDGAGNSNAVLNYRHLDEKTINGTSYYRLKQTDFDGNFEYSDILSYTFSSVDQNLVQIHPNPVSTNFLMAFGKNLKTQNLKIFDIYGRDVTHQILINYTESGCELNISEIGAGNYFLSTETSVTKFSKL